MCWIHDDGKTRPDFRLSPQHCIWAFRRSMATAFDAAVLSGFGSRTQTRYEEDIGTIFHLHVVWLHEFYDEHDDMLCTADC